MNGITDASEEAFKWFSEKSAAQWNRSHFQDYLKCDILLNNLCEPFNSSILVARRLDISKCSEYILKERYLKDGIIHLVQEL